MAAANTAYDLWLEGIKESDQAHYPQAIAKFKQAVTQDHEFSSGYKSWGEAALNSADPATALHELQEAVEKYYDKAMGHYILGNIYQRMEQYPQAVAEFEKAIAQDKNFVDAYIDGGLAYDHLKQYDKAIANYQQAIALDPNSAISYNNWGWVLVEMGDHQGAIQKFKQALQLDPYEPHALENWAVSILKLQDPEAALSDFRQMIEKHLPTAEAYTKLARTLLDLKKDAEAVAAYEHVFALDPNAKDAYLACGLAHYNLKQYDKSIACYQQAIKLDPSSAISYNNWGRVLQAKNDYATAIEKHKQAVQIDPSYLVALEDWSDTIAKLNEPDAALADFRKTVEEKFPTLDGYKHLYKTLYELKKYRDTLDICQRALTLDPNYVDALIYSGLAHNKLGERDQAIAAYKQAIKHQPDSALIFVNWGWVLHGTGMIHAAIKKYKEALNNDPSYSLALSNWASAIVRLPEEEVEAEIATYHDWVNTALSPAQAYSHMGQLFTELMRYDKALAALQLAVEKDPQSAEAQLKLGYALQLTGNPDGATAAYQKALTINPEYAAVYNYLGPHYTQLGEYAKAIAAYRKAIELDPHNEFVYSGWSYTIKFAKHPEEELKAFHTAVFANFRPADANKMIGSTLYYDFKRNEEACTHFVKAIQLDPQLADAYFELANVQRDMYLYDESIDNYKRAISIKAHSYYYHNHADILQKLGRYKEARHKWLDAVHGYLKYEQDTAATPDTWFYIYYGYICLDIFKDYAAAEQAFTRSLKRDPNNYYAHLILAKLYLEQEDNTLSDSEADRKTRNLCNYKAWNAYRHAETLLKRKNQNELDVETLLDLAELYMTFSQYELAKENLEKIQKLSPDYLKAIQTAGVLAMKMENYTEALKYFKSAHAQDTDNLEVRANLGRAYQKLKRNTEAENEFQHVLAIAGYHVDALIGLSEVYISEAEAADEKGNTGDAVIYFNKAIHVLNKLLKYTDPPSVYLPDVPRSVLDAPISRALTQNEISSIYYSLGYARTKLSETKKFSNRALLQQAQSDFRHVKFGTPNFFKAERAGNKLEELSDTLNKSGSGKSTLTVAILAFTIFWLAQFGFFIGKPILGYANLTVNHAALDTLLKNAKVDTRKFRNEIQTLKSSTFVLEQQIASSLKPLLGKQELASDQLNDLIQRGGKLQLKGFEKIGDATYASLSFGSLIFMVAGLFLREITKLKFGAVELEKASTNQVTISTSLNITR
jgi:tetratricopeptide (TPR) repeat protein